MPCQCFLINFTQKKAFPIIGSNKVIEKRKEGKLFVSFRDQTGLQILALDRKRVHRKAKNNSMLPHKS